MDDEELAVLGVKPKVHEKLTALKAKTHAFTRDYTARPRKLPRQQDASGGKPAGGI